MRLEGVSCALSCCFCIVGETKRLGRVPEPSRSGAAPPPRAEILRDVDAVLRGAPPGRQAKIFADDILEFDGVLDILAAYRRRGQHCTLTTPGLRLADPAFARAVSRFDVSFCITYLARTPGVYAAMTDNPRAQDQVERAIANMRRLGIQFHVNCILTRHNLRELAGVARYILLEEAQSHFTIVNFYLERCLLEANPAASELFAPLPDLREPLSDIRKLVLRHDKDVALVDIPPCQLNPEIRRCARFHFEFAHPPDFKACSPEPMFNPPSCRRCVLAAQCSRVSAHYCRLVQPRITLPPLTAADLSGSS